MRKLPSTVTTYLQTVNDIDSEPFFLHLDENNFLVEWSTASGLCGQESQEDQMFVVDQLQFLEELLPCTAVPVVLPRVQLLVDRYYDIHLFANDLGQWIIFVDTTIASRQAQQLQQVRLSRELQIGSRNGT